MCDFSPELSVDGQTAVQCFSGAGGETEREFALEHEDGDAGWVGEGEELEDEGGGNLVRMLEAGLEYRAEGMEERT